MRDTKLNYSKLWRHPDRVSDLLYDFQIAALNNATKYMNSKIKDDHALIKMPTGTGKTLIIYIIANFFKKVENVLIVTPSETVKKHILHEIEGGISEKFGMEDTFKKEGIELLPSNVDSVLKIKKACIYVSTIQSLSQIKQKTESIEEAEKIKKGIDLIIFDEGHKEPAPEWKKAIRELGKKVILFTATPIRNDKNKLQISTEHVYNLSIQEAMQKNYLRNPIFIKTEKDSIEEFLDEIIQKKSQLKEKDRVIIRFANIKDLVKAYDYLEKKQEKVVAIHEEFSSVSYPSKSMVKKVASVLKNEEVEYTYWLHQNKLIEGIDDQRFRLLAIFDGFSSAGPLIQQVGRVIRHSNFGSTDKEHCYVIYKSSSRVNQEALWNDYLLFEKEIKVDKKILSFDFGEYLKKVIDVHPNTIYSNSKMMTKINLEQNEQQGDYLNRYKIPLSVNIYKINDGSILTIDNIAEKLNDIYLENDISIIETCLNSATNFYFCFFCYYKNSPYLENKAFLELNTGLLVVKVINDRIYIYNSLNFIPAFILDEAAPISPRVLEMVFDEKSIFRQLSIKNGNISRNEVSRTSFFAENMDYIAPQVSDKYKFATTVNGRVPFSSENYVNRYVGFKNGRVSDSMGYTTLGEYLSWIEELEVTFQKTYENKSIFDRYAPITSVPDDTSPAQIMIELEEDIKLVDKNGVSLILESTMAMVDDEGLFDLETILGEKYKFKVIFNAKKRKYSISEVLKNSILIDGSPILNLTTYLNRSQAFHIITNTLGYIYSNNFFMKVGLEREKAQLPKIFKEYELKEDITELTEKGPLIEEAQRKDFQNNWGRNSLFYLLANKGESLDEKSEVSKDIADQLRSLDYLICVDLEYEIADFIGIKDSDGTRRVYFIHAKAKKNKTGISASGFQDVCSQIVKNLDYVHPLSTEVPDLEKWEREWTQSSYMVKRPRIENLNGKPYLNPKELWKLIKDIQQDQNGEVYVWAFLGNMLSLEKYIKVTVDGKDNNAIIPLIYMLSNTWYQVQSVGAKFEVLFNKISVR